MPLVPRGAVALLASALALAETAVAQTVRQITSFSVVRLGEHALDDAGNAVIAVTTADPFGANPTHEFQAVAWTGPGAGSMRTHFGGLGQSVSVSDDGQWLAFLSMADPLGQNAGRGLAVLLQSADGSVLRQLAPEGYLVRISGSGNRVVFGRGATLMIVDVSTGASADVWLYGGIESLSISDNGEVIAFSSNGDPLGGNADKGFEVFRVMADGSGLLQLTASDTEDATGAVIAGNGQRIAYASGGQVHVFSSFGGQPVHIGPGSRPSITDDGALVYYSASDEDNTEIYRSTVEGAIAQRLTRTSPPLSNESPQVSGSGNRVAFVRFGTVADPAAGTLMRMNANGSAIEQLGTAETDWTSWEPDITSDGRRVVFLGGTLGRHDVFRIQADGSDLVRLTQGAEAWHPSVTEDGETIVFQSALDLAGGNACGTAQVFRIRADGTGLAQLSPPGGCAVREHPVISRDGSTVVYQEDGTRLYSVPAGGGTPVLVVADSSAYWKRPRLSRDGSWVVYQSAQRAFLARTDGSGTQPISGDSFLDAYYPDISADGSKVAYSKLGFHFDDSHFSAAWLYTPATGSQHMLAWASPLHSRISGDGESLYYVSNPGNVYPERRVRRLLLATGQVTWVHGLPDPRTRSAMEATVPTIAVDEAGRVAVSWPVNWTDENPDLNQEIWLIDLDAAPRWEIDVTIPARVRFSPDPFATTYDVIRGDLANLGFGLDGTVDLGAVVCLADDTASSSAVDFEGPAPNQGFFYLFRAAAGWGASSSGAARVPGSGGCP